MLDERGRPDYGGGERQEFTFSHDGRELHCFTTSALHGQPHWAVTIGNRTFGTSLAAHFGHAAESVRPYIIEWYEFEKARGTFDAPRRRAGG